MLYTNTFKKYQIQESKINEIDDSYVVFVIDDDKLDQMLHSKFARKLDHEDVKGDSYYTLPQQEFDRFIDLADSSGFDVDYENSENSLLYIKEMSTSAGAGGYETPNAFGELSNDSIEILGYKKVKKVKKVKTEAVKESDFMKFSKQMFINEISYNTYKKDPVATPKHKINKSINLINKGLKEIEHVVNHNVRLKQEIGVDNSIYWKSSRENLAKISELLLRVSRQLKELAS